MRVFVAGATGAIGQRLVPMLVAAGHQVYGMTRSVAKTDRVSALGATPVVADALDRDAVLRAVREAAPEAVVHELTSIPHNLNLRRMEQQFALTNRLRTEGLDNLIAAAREAGSGRFVAQSYTSWPYAREGGPIKTEEDPLDSNPPRALRSSLEAIRYVERTVASLTPMRGIVLRYGSLYGPGNTLGEGGAMLEAVRKRQVPIVGGGKGIWSFIHVDDAAAATVRAIETEVTGIYNIVDDDPAPVSEWLPALSQAVGAKLPFHVPGWLGRLAIGAQGVMMMTTSRGASNAKAKRELGWEPRWRSWRDGFRSGLGADSQDVVSGRRLPERLTETPLRGR